jgi:Cu-Zn family superoxide dismutase
MRLARLIAAAAVCSSAFLLAQAPAGPGRGAAGGTTPPPGPPPTAAAPQNTPPVPADQNLPTGQGRGGALFGHAHANIAGANGLKGTADFYEIANSGNGHMMQVVLSIENAPPGIHGVHIHAVGKCEGPMYTTAGGHFDPGPAGDPNPDTNHPFHMGDLPNVTVAANGTGMFNVYSTRITMGGPTSIFDADGSAIVVHGNLDQGISGPNGSGLSGGPRIGCGVIER